MQAVSAGDSKSQARRKGTGSEGAMPESHTEAVYLDRLNKLGIRLVAHVLLEDAYSSKLG